MKKLFCSSIIILLFTTACGVTKSLDKAPDFSILKKGLSKDEVRVLLGKPLAVDNLGNEIYKVCISEQRSYGRATVHALFDFATLGLWEIYANEAEDKNYGRIAVVYDRTDKSVGFLYEIEYEFCKKVLALVTNEWKKTDKASKYVLIHFDENNGWFFVDKDNIRCSFRQKYFKVYLKKIPTVKSIIKKIAQHDLEDIPVYELQTIFFDPSNNTYTEKYMNFYNAEGELLLSLNNDETYDWMEMYPNSLAKALYDILAVVCFREHEQERAKEKEQVLKGSI